MSDQPEFICPKPKTCLLGVCLHNKPHLLFSSCLDDTHPFCPNCVIVDVVTIKDEKPLDEEK